MEPVIKLLLAMTAGLEYGDWLEQPYHRDNWLVAAKRS
jgi:hypothetical protein